MDYDFDGVLDLYERGATITLNRAQQGSDSLAACADLSRELRAHVNANVYITPPRAQGFSAHPDTHDVFLVQVEGSKRWRVQVGLEYLATSRNRNRVSDPDRVERWDEFELHPRDVLYLPRGLLHAGMTDLSHSLHITLRIHPYIWSDVIRDALAELEHDDVMLRRSATVGEGDFADALETITSSLTALISDRARMRDLIERRTTDQAAGSRRGRFLDLTDRDRISLDTPIRRRPDVAVEVHATDDEVIVATGTKSIAFPGYVAEHVEALLSDAPSTPRQLPASLDESGRLVLCRTLVAEGVLQVH